MFISVVICTWNRARLLDQTLQQIRSIAIPPDVTWELVVVNNNCTDDTEGVLSRYKEHLPLRTLFEPTPGLSHARNRALDNTRGDWILWADDDVLVSPEWLESFAATARRHPDAAAIGGPIDPWFPEPPPPEFLEAFPVLRGGYIGTDYGEEERTLSESEPVWAANLGYERRRTADMRFNTELGRVKDSLVSGEDHDFMQRVRGAGGAVYYSPRMRVKHYVDPSRVTEAYLFKFYEGLGVTTIRMGGVEGRKILGMPAWVIRRCVESGLWAPYYKLTGQRIARLKSWREFYRCLGMLKASLASGRGGQPAARA